MRDIIPTRGMQPRPQTETITGLLHFALSRADLLSQPSLLATFSSSVGVSISLCLFCWDCYHQPPPAHSIQDTISPGNLSLAWLELKHKWLARCLLSPTLPMTEVQCSSLSLVKVRRSFALIGGFHARKGSIECHKEPSNGNNALRGDFECLELVLYGIRHRHQVDKTAED